MRHPIFLSLLVLGLFGCGGTTANSAVDTDAGSSGGGSGASGDLPCDVSAILQKDCVSCHGSTPSGGAPMALVTYDDLAAPAKTDASKSVAQLSLERIQDTARPMPPAPASMLSSADVATFQAWVQGGASKGSCQDGTSSGTNYDTPTTCTSNKTWTGGDRGSASMHPGGTCISCHSQGDGPTFSIAGTVYPSAHEPADCNGVSGGLTVVVTDAKGQVVKLPVNSVGNFYSSRRSTITPPYTAKVVDANGKERAMSAAQTTGDCNSCHTESGANSAPGRIMAP